MALLATSITNRPSIPPDVCADCGMLDPSWASVNRGILICEECCSIHRSLGRQISQVKSLRKEPWSPSQREMVLSLSNSGANRIWEHTLLDPSSLQTLLRKPQPKDPVHPDKAEFIRAKHQMMSFVYKPNREDLTFTDLDVSHQLHASVRTGNLETSLHLLCQGADPNYVHKDKGNSPIHVASKAGQEKQVELLVLYGADPGARDRNGRAPNEYARDGGFPEIAIRLVELQYELTDSLAFYLCGRQPEHANGCHWIIPEMVDHTDGRKTLPALPSHSFEELACDVYDEVDRRETDSVWLSMQNQSVLLSDMGSVPFLPLNQEFSSTRNQGRQKLARLSAREFAALIIDILIEARKRMGSHYLRNEKEEMGDITVTPTDISHINSYIYHPYTDKHADTYDKQICPTFKPHSVMTKFDSLQSNSSLRGKLTRPYFMTKDSLHDDEPLYDSVTSEDDSNSWERKRKLKNHQEDILKIHLPSSFAVRDSSYQAVVCKTEVLTKLIQELLMAAQDSMLERFVPCSEGICTAVQEMADLFPKNGCPAEIETAVQMLVVSAIRLQLECHSRMNSQLHLLDPERVIQMVIQCAYNIAKAAKTLVAHFQ